MNDLFPFQVIYKVGDFSVILSVMIEVKGNIIITEHLHKIGIKTIFTITVKINWNY